MRSIEQSVRVISMTQDPLKVIEEAGRVCYRTQDRITEDSAKGFVERIIRRGHLSVLEFADVTLEFTVSRGVADEIRTHRICSHLMQSTRYVDMQDEVVFVRPVWATPETIGHTQGEHFYAYTNWLECMTSAEAYYRLLREGGLPPEHARGVLPLDLATVMVTKANFRQWMTIFGLRCDKAAHPAMRQIMSKARFMLAERVPEVFQCDTQ
jgi:thymidylate synthase (FAD)